MQLTPEMMAEVWEAHSLNKQNLTELTMHQFEAYRNELIKASNMVPTPDVPQSLGASKNQRGAAMVSRKRETPAATMVTPTSSSKRQKQPSPDIPTSSVDQLAKGTSVPSPVRSASGATSVVKKPPVNLPKYEERTKVGHVVVSYPVGHISQDDANASGSKQRRCVVTTKEDSSDDDVTRYNIKEPYRHMFTTLEDRASALERHLVRTRTAIVEDIEKERRNKIQNNAGDDVEAVFEEVNVPRQHPSTCVGRICNEAHNGKINSTSVVLEGSSSSCGGARVNVDLSHMQKKEQQQNGYSLFPGQIVAIEGINGTGRKIMATKIKEGVSVPPASSSVKSIQKHYGVDSDKQEQVIAPLKVMSACGPFTTAKSMDYAPFVDLMNVVLEENPDVVILAGPFVDVRQEAVQSGRVTCDEEGEEQDVVVDYETLFSQRIAAVIEEVFEDKSMVTEFVLVPALEDAVAKFV